MHRNAQEKKTELLASHHMLISNCELLSDATKYYLATFYTFNKIITFFLSSFSSISTLPLLIPLLNETRVSAMKQYYTLTAVTKYHQPFSL